MPTRLKRPSFWRQLALAGALVAFQSYLGYNAIGGQFGVESQKQMQQDIVALKATSASLQAELDAYRHRVELFRADRLDPDILSERARALLSMAQEDDIIVMLPSQPSELITGSSSGLAGDQLTAILQAMPTPSPAPLM
jgi:cell division protein FtsB